MNVSFFFFLLIAGDIVQVVASGGRVFQAPKVSSFLMNLFLVCAVNSKSCMSDVHQTV